MNLDGKRVASCWCGFFLLAIAACNPASNPPDGGSDPDGGNDCPVLCTVSSDCCAEQTCIDGVCASNPGCPSGCNYECDKAVGKVCNRVTQQCESGPPPVNCVDDCDCYAGETCRAGVCELGCGSDADCPGGQICSGGVCSPASCLSREDCAGADCLICKAGMCTAPPAVCQGEQDCCVGQFCQFGTCTPEEEGCVADSDCPNPDLPSCVEGKCVPAESECQSDLDCPLPGQVCLDQRCMDTGCTVESCLSGQWCDQATGLCKPGCDANDDCPAPTTCDYVSHQCQQPDCCGGACTPGSQVCDPQTCQCIEVCVDDLDCPAGYTCRQADGSCVCTDLACPAGTHCDAQSGECVQDAFDCDPAEFTSAIQCGDSVSGSFDEGCDSTQRLGSYAKQFTFPGLSGQTAVIDLACNPDAFLYLLGPGGAVLASNDDGGDGSDARIVEALTIDGIYVIEATTYTPSTTGAFDLSLICSDCTTVMACGETLAGSFSPTCLSDQRAGSYAQRFTFEGTAEDVVVIDLTSPDVDTFLYLLDPNGAVLGFDDDGGPYTDSQIAISLPVDGSYTIEATTLRSGFEGDFSLSLTCSEGSDCVVPISCGELIADAFGPPCEAPDRNGSYGRVYTFEAVPDQPIVIDLRSDAVDAYLLLISPEFWIVDYDDDSGAGKDARITGTPLVGGTWYIEATTYGSSEIGPYEIELTCQ